MAEEGIFKLVAITRPFFFDKEEEQICSLLDSGFDYVHLRKPLCDEADLRRLIEMIPRRYYSRLRIHDFPQLAVDYGLWGVHLNSRNPVPPQGVTSVSRSCHEYSELDSPVCNGCALEYQTLSPIFDSISKVGYKARFDLADIRSHIEGKKVVALGGITMDCVPLLKSLGFYGAAMLGAAWK